MYRINPLHRNVLITSDEVVAKAPVDQDIDVRNIQNSIEIAEERFIVPVLGYPMYEAFVNAKNTLITADNKTTIQTAVNIGNTGDAITLQEGQIINAIEFVTNAKYKELWNRFLWKICAECVAYTAIPINAVRTTAQGEMQNNPAGPMSGTGAASVELKTLKYKRDTLMMDRIDPLIDAMKKWLCENKSSSDLSLWDSSICGPCEPTHKRMSGFVFGIYDDRKSKCDCE